MKIPLQIPSRTFLLLIVLAGLRVIGSAEPFETIISHGPPNNRVDIAIVGDGYTAAELTKYRNDVQTFVQAIFAQDPYREYQRYFNVHRIDVISNQSGADHPERNSFVNTAFDATYNCFGSQRRICIDYNKVEIVLQRTLTPVQYDIKIAIVNDPEYGGSGGSFAVSSTDFRGSEIVPHELGHTFGLLADEYSGTRCGFLGNYPNVTATTDRNQIQWNYWIEPATPIPTHTTTPAVPGLYQGGGVCDSYYRPT